MDWVESLELVFLQRQKVEREKLHSGWRGLFSRCRPFGKFPQFFFPQKFQFCRRRHALESARRWNCVEKSPTWVNCHDHVLNLEFRMPLLMGLKYLSARAKPRNDKLQLASKEKFLTLSLLLTQSISRSFLSGWMDPVWRVLLLPIKGDNQNYYQHHHYKLLHTKVLLVMLSKPLKGDHQNVCCCWGLL